MGYLFGLERRAVAVSVQTLRAELLFAVAGVGHEAQGLQARVRRTRIAQQPKSISATCLRAFKTVSQDCIRRITTNGSFISSVTLPRIEDAERCLAGPVEVLRLDVHGDEGESDGQGP